MSTIRRTSQTALSTFPRFNTTLLSMLLLSSALAVAPTGNAGPIDVTAAPDVAVNVTQAPTMVHIETGAAGDRFAFADIMPVTTPAGGRLVAGSPYDVTFEGIRTDSSTGYGYSGSATSVSLVNGSDGSQFGSGQPPLTANLVGASPTYKDAVFGGVVFPGPGIYVLKAGANNVSHVLVYPADDIGLTVQPSSLSYVETGAVVTITATNATGPATSAAITSNASGFIQGSGTTNSNGQLAFFSSLPMGAGTFRVFARYDLNGASGHQTGMTASGATVSLPERLSSVPFTVMPASLTRQDANTTAYVGFQNAVGYIPKFPSSGNLVFPTSGSPSPNWPAAAGGWTNISIAQPNGYIVFANVTSAVTGQSLFPMCLNASATAGGAGSCASIHGSSSQTPSVFSISSDGAFNFAPSTSGGWLPGTYTFSVQVNTAGGASSAPEYHTSWSLVPSQAAGVNVQPTPARLDVPAPTSFSSSGSPGTSALAVSISGANSTEHPLCATSNSAGTACVSAGWETDASFLDNITLSGDVLPGWSVASYTPSNGVAVFNGVTPTRNGTVLLNVTWKNVTTTTVLPVVRGASASSSNATLAVNQTTSFTVRVRDAYGNDVTAAAVVIFKRTGGAGSFSGTAVTAITGTGAPDYGQGGLYRFTLTPNAIQELVAVARIGSGADTNYSYVPIDVVADQISLSVSPVSPRVGDTVELTARLVGAGTPLQSARIVVTGVAGTVLDTATDPAGRATFTALASGPFTAVATSPGYGGATTTFQVASNSTPPPPPTPPPSSSNTTIRIGRVAAGPLYPVTAPITIANVTDLGALTLGLSFDPAVVEIVNVTPGGLPGAAYTWNLNNTTGNLTVLVTFDTLVGASGNHTVVNVTFRPKGLPGTTSALRLTAIELVHPDGTAFQATTVDGVFRSGLVGDVDGDGVVGPLDVNALSQYVVGLRPASQIVAANADTNRDGKISGSDSMFLSQFVAGNRAVLEW